MLVPLRRRVASEDLVDLLLECHERIRRFLAMARSLAQAAPAATPQEVAAAAAQIRRYFTEALALHVEDEELDIAPHLARPAAERLGAEHAGHTAMVVTLVGICGDLERDGAALPARAAELGAVARTLTDVMETHLAFEETQIFPEVRRLDPARQQTIREAMRARRDRHLGIAG